MTVRGVRLRRLGQLAAVLARHLLAVAIGSRRGPLGALAPPAWRERGTMSEPERLHALIEELGGSFLKLGQLLALQSDLLPREFCDALCKLLDRVPPFSFAEVERIFAAELGSSPEALFDAVESSPIASASIGQVHVAYLEGRKLAVKVQRPNAERDFGGDIRLMELAVTWIRRLRLRRFDYLVEPLTDVIEWTAAELDFRAEARTMKVLRRASDDRAHQRIPAVLESHSTRRILVMEFFDGTTLLDYLRARESGDEVTVRRLAAEGFDAGGFAAHVIDNFLHQSFVHGLFHADLHPANLMILPGNVVGYLDLGITGTLSPYSRRRLMEMTLAYTRGDIEGMSAAFEGVSLADEAAAGRYRQGLLRLSEDWYDRSSGTLHLRKSFTFVMLEMLRLAHETGAWGQRDIIKYIRSCVALDALVTRCAPGMDLGRLLEQACTRHAGAVPWRTHPASLLAVSAAGARRLLATGRRATALLGRLADRDLPIYAELPEPERGPADSGRPELSFLALLVLALALAPGLPDPVTRVGFNLFTAQVLVLAFAFGRLAFPARRTSSP